ncbi:acyl-[acyl-carrier-protein] thioesterase [Leptospira gomenensis]|uniref:Acyl-[acyl-carrier-protein] thioesterase n=1 Tax=Leptospira gomenensis TaxID=2484974 RepID=A0A5F1YH35_9LEPT|nr:acyl-[acyl-carrier-protein] thioesterase [Leptospira gomenensis]TGK32389.1 acyl-[acyl-carrier-protein] thioesterase [Leptospira gomenensis]TGK43967.1 acyl-[acyl-carrier-protein] thioesterase [Leptospira gomenensis]TGK48956.1 acyl-[acyl-carrier-protein] thioesterase [Leptospira gomenensis]TGK54667.1 acyl-[acyl-carrier-protein] thioesterase [Leptospira gomenensis]
MIADEIQLVTRISDLDTQRHVTSRTYENFCLEGRFRLLEKNGFPLRDILSQGFTIRPLESSIRFLAQQMEGADLKTETKAYALKNGMIFWDQKVLSDSETPAAEIKTLTLCEKKGNPVDLLPAEKTEMTGYDQFAEIPDFRGTCKTVDTELITLYSERNIFGDYNPAYLWRIVEDSRWFFSTKAGLTLDRFVQMDTTMFFMGGVFRFFHPVPAGRKVKVSTWIHSFEKIRSYMRHEVTDCETGLRYFAVQDEQLVVSLSKARPKKAPEEFQQLVGEYVENFEYSQK